VSEDVGDEHRGGLLNVIAAGMEERVEGELRTAWEVIAFRAPRDILHRGDSPCVIRCATHTRDSPPVPGIDTDAHRSLLFESSEVAVKALLAHQLPCLKDEFLG